MHWNGFGLKSESGSVAGRFGRKSGKDSCIGTVSAQKVKVAQWPAEILGESRGRYCMRRLDGKKPAPNSSCPIGH
jgi:hypothetical protein